MAGKGLRDSTTGNGIDLLDAGSHRWTLATSLVRGKHVLDIHDADIHENVINQYLHQHSGIVTTLTTAVVGDGTEYEIDIADATGFVVGDYLHINTSSIESTHPQLLATTAATGPATFTLDRRLDKSHAIGDEVEVAITDMSSQIGSLAAPQEYWVAPPAGEVWHLTRILFEMTHGTAGDLGLFGNLTALTNGVLIRVRRDGVYGTLTNWKNNGDIKTDMFDVVFDSRSGGGGSYGTSGRGTFTNAGAVVRLDGDTNDRLELYVQDNITALDSFTMKAQGHLEGV